MQACGPLSRNNVQAATARKSFEIKPVVDPDAKVYPRSISGPYTRWRWVFVWLTQIVFYGLCWLPWHGRQAVLFDIDNRKFYFFDLVLWPQDTIYLVLLMILGALALFLFTAVAGRCGAAIPARKPSTRKFSCGSKKSSKASGRSASSSMPPRGQRASWPSRVPSTHLGLFSLWTGITFVGYFMPIRELMHDLLTLSTRRLVGILGGLLRLRHLRQCRLPARPDVPADLPLRPLPVRDVRPGHADHRLRHGPWRIARPARQRQRPARRALAIASIVASAFRSARPASTSATACRTSASAALPVSTPATRSWTR
jgi:hypothetical protein